MPKPRVVALGDELAVELAHSLLAQNVGQRAVGGVFKFRRRLDGEGERVQRGGS